MNNTFRSRKVTSIPSDFNGFRVTALCRGGKDFIHIAHDRRDLYVVRGEKDHIYEDGYHETILDSGSIQQAFNNLFEDARVEYNKGKRSDRQIKNYYDLIGNDSRKGKHKNQEADGSRKHAYQFHFYIGNRESHAEDEITKQVLKDFCTQYMPKHYPNFVLTHIFIHGDEWSWNDDKTEKIDSPIHVHATGIFVAHCLNEEEKELEKKRRERLKSDLKLRAQVKGETWDEKKWLRNNWQRDLVSIYGKSLTSGMKKQCSMSAALAEMGFYTEQGKGTAQQQFEESVRHDLQDFAESYGIKIDRSLGRKHSHMEKDLYQKSQENERKASELSKRENAVVQMEAPLQKRERLVSAKEANIAKREEEIGNNISDVVKREYELSKKQKAIDLLENDIAKREKAFESLKETFNSYEKLAYTVQKNNVTFDSAVKSLYKENEGPLQFRLKRFVAECKAVVVTLVNELHRYKEAFKSFWHATPSFFRNLASKMERESCQTYEEYDKKRRDGSLSEQQNNKINNDYHYSR